tara:strand:- start:777 stop:1088 length:312 start_codon:yes stop_codon:yes gene_type:complete
MPLNKQGKPIYYKPFKGRSTPSSKKYSVYIPTNTKKGYKTIHFGDTRYQQFKDKIGTYKQLDHGDPVRRKSYLARAKGIKNKQGELTWKDRSSPNYYSVRYLW